MEGKGRDNTGKQPKQYVKRVFPGPSLPLDSHPDRVAEFLDRWNMRPKQREPEKQEGPPQPNPPLSRPPGWEEVVGFVSPTEQQPPKQKGRPKKTDQKVEVPRKREDEEVEEPGKRRGRSQAKSAQKRNEQNREPGDELAVRGGKSAKKVEEKRVEDRAGASDGHGKKRRLKRLEADEGELWEWGAEEWDGKEAWEWDGDEASGWDGYEAWDWDGCEAAASGPKNPPTKKTKRCNKDTPGADGMEAAEVVKKRKRQADSKGRFVCLFTSGSFRG